MEVSDDERTRGLIEPEKLARWMDERGLPGRGEPVEARFISGGASNEIFEIRRGEARMALRRPPRKVPEGRNETMLREYRVLAALRDTGVPHTRVLAACDDPSLIGACFYLMEYVDGWSCMNLDGWPPPFDTDLEARKGLAWELVDAIARLGRVDWKARGLEGFGRPEGFHERQVDRWLAHLSRFKFRDLPGARRGGRLAARPQAAARTSRASSTATTSSPTSCSTTARRRAWRRSSTGRWRRSAIRCSTSPGW